MGLYYLEEGVSVRPSQVIYDRGSSAFAEYDYKDVDFENILKDYDWLHLSGITPALSYNCRRLIDKAIKAAKKLGLTVSFDPNFRSTLWSFETARDVLSRYLPYVDVLIGIEPIHDTMQMVQMLRTALLWIHHLRIWTEYSRLLMSSTI